MSFGKMNTKIQLIQTINIKDGEGFSAPSEIVIATIRAYREGRHGTEKWANRAVFSEATDLFRFRYIPKIDIKTDMVIACDEKRFEITSVENVKGRGLYIEILAKVVESG